MRDHNQDVRLVAVVRTGARRSVWDLRVVRRSRPAAPAGSGNQKRGKRGQENATRSCEKGLLNLHSCGGFRLWPMFIQGPTVPFCLRLKCEVLSLPPKDHLPLGRVGGKCAGNSARTGRSKTSSRKAVILPQPQATGSAWQSPEENPAADRRLEGPGPIGWAAEP